MGVIKYTGQELEMKKQNSISKCFHGSKCTRATVMLTFSTLVEEWMIGRKRLWGGAYSVAEGRKERRKGK